MDANICAQRKNVLLQMLNGTVCIHLGIGPERSVLSSEWNDDTKINTIIHELNFGRYKEDIA